MLRSIIAAVAARGYATTTVADIVRGARVSREAFYSQFADKEDCFVAACESGCDLMFRRVIEAGRATPPPAEATDQLRAGVRAYLQFLTDEPEFARTFLLEVLTAGPAAVGRRASVHRRFAELTRIWHARARAEHASWPRVPDETYIAIVGAFHELVAERIREGQEETLRALEDLVVELHVALLAGGAPW